MACVTCSNCGFVNSLLPPNPSSDGLVSELLRGSRPLFDVDRAFIDAEITKLKRLKAWYDDQLQEIQSPRLAVLRELENRESIYAPIRRLPRDILIEIFDWVSDTWSLDAVTEDDDLEEVDSLDVNGPLWVLARVCGLWRDTLHASPASWASYVNVKPPFPKHTREVLQTYLERTGDHPLSLVVICEGTDLTKEGQIMSLVVQCHHRWKDVCISIDMHHTHYLESISHLPVLQAIEINFTDVINHDYEYRSDICLKAPQLRQATLANQGIHLVRLPLTVTHYSGYLPCVDDFPFLSQLPKLRTCHLAFSRLPPGSMPEAPVVMGELCQLYVGDLKVLNFLTAPMVQSLTLSAITGPQSLSSITLFFRRSRCRLESFSMSMDILKSEPSASIREIFSSEACTTISHLKLELSSISHNVANALAAPSILPNLHHLCLCFNEKLHPHTEAERLALLDMIRSRCKAGLLKTIEVQFDVEESRDIEADIRALTSAILHPYRTYRRYRRYRPFYRIPILYMAYTTISPIPYTPTLALHYRH